MKVYPRQAAQARILIYIRCVYICDYISIIIITILCAACLYADVAYIQVFTHTKFVRGCCIHSSVYTYTGDPSGTDTYTDTQYVLHVCALMFVYVFTCMNTRERVCVHVYETSVCSRVFVSNTLETKRRCCCTT